MLSLPLFWHGSFDERPDASLYLITTQNWLAGSGYSYLGTPFVIRPPGFPALIAPVLAGFGTSFAALNLYVSLWGVAAALLFFLFARERVRAPVAGALAIALWLNPLFRELSTQVMSDVPGLAFFFACLLLERRARRRGSVRGDVWAAVAIGLATWVRSGNLLIAPAVIVSRLWKHGFAAWRSLLVYAVLPPLVFAPWWIHTARVDVPEPAVQTFLHSYGTALFHEDVGDPTSRRLDLGDWLERGELRLREVLPGLGGRLSPDREGELWLGVLALALVAALAWRRRAPAEGAALLTALVLSLYFAYRPRLLLPVFAVALLAAAELIQFALSRWKGRAWGDGAACALLVAIAAVDFRLPDRAGIAAGEESLRVAAAAVERDFPESVVATAQGWQLGVFLPGRDVWSLQRAFLRSGPAGPRSVFREHGIEVCLFDRTKPLHLAIRQSVADRLESAGRVGDWDLFLVQGARR